MNNHNNIKYIMQACIINHKKDLDNQLLSIIEFK